MRTVLATSSVIFLGKKGENLAAQVAFPVLKEWRQLYGDGTFQLIHQRNGDALPYAVVLAEGDEDVLWPVTNTDVNKPGMGKCELQYYVTDANNNNILAKSMTFLTKVVEGLDNAGETPPEPWTSWVESVLEAGSEAEQSAVAAGEFAQEASGYAEEAKGSAEDAEGYAEASRLSAEDSAESANQAASFVTQASGYADSAMGAAELASQHADRASTYKDQAQGYAETARTQAQTAAGHASNASTSATHASEYADAAAASAAEIEDLEVESTTLQPGSSASVEKSGGSGGEPYKLTFGIPQGEKGDTGEKGDKGDTGDVNFATFELDPHTGLLTAVYTFNDSHIIFDLTSLGYLEVAINE